MSRRLVVLAMIVLLAVLATRAAAAAPAAEPTQVSVGVASDCDLDLGCDDGGADSSADGDAPSPGDDLEPDLGTRALPLAIAEVSAAAVRAAGLDHDPAPGWTLRTRLAGLVPMVSARIGRDLTWKDVDDPTLGYTNMYDVRATWHLERLLFDPNEIRIAALDVSRRREKRRVEMLAVHSYLMWLRVPRGSPRAALLAADLDAITDGWFSHALAKRGKP